jgi:hypothetical protein
VKLKQIPPEGLIAEGIVAEDLAPLFYHLFHIGADFAVESFFFSIVRPDIKAGIILRAPPAHEHEGH